MPGFDGTGPRGLGPRTGRGLGPCGGGYRRGYGRRGYGAGYGRGWGYNNPNPPTKEEEKENLERDLEDIKKRLADLDQDK